MVNQASSVSSATTSVTSPVSKAAVSRRTSARSAAECGSGGSGRRAGGWRRSSAARARLSALVTDSSVVLSSCAVSLARNPSTSRRMRAARCRGGSSWRAVMNASEIDSADSYLASGPRAVSATPLSRSSG